MTVFRTLREHPSTAPWDEDEAFALLRAMLKRVAAAYPPGSDLAAREEPWTRLDAAIDAAFAAKDMAALRAALDAYETEALRLFAEAASREEETGEKTHVQSVAYADPRPDIHEDSHLWPDLLRWAHEMDEQLFRHLRRLRGYGLRLMMTNAGSGEWRWILQPDPAGRWDKSVSYEEVKTKWLKPYRAQIVELLRKLPSPPRSCGI